MNEERTLVLKRETVTMLSRAAPPGPEPKGLQPLTHHCTHATCVTCYGTCTC